MLRIDLEDLLIERNRARGELHRLKEFRKLKVRRGVPRIQFDGFLELADRFLPVLRHRRQAPRQNCAVLRHVRLELHALAQPQNRSGKIVTAQALFGPGEAFVYGFLPFGLALAEREGARSGKLLVVAGALLLIHKSPVRRRQPAHQILEQSDPFALPHVAVGVEFLRQTMEALFHFTRRRRRGNPQQVIVGPGLRQFEKFSDLRCKLNYARGLLRRNSLSLGRRNGNVRLLFRSRTLRHADNDSQNHQRIERAGAFVLGQFVPGQEFFRAYRSGDRINQLPFAFLQLNGLITQQRVRRKGHA